MLKLAAPWLAALFIALCIAAIPYGAPVSRGYGIVMLAAFVAMLACARASTNLWDTLTLWPVMLLLAVYAIGCVASIDQAPSVARFTTMPLYAMLFVAVQLCAWSPRALRAVAICGLAAMLAIAIDASYSRATGRPLFHEGDVSLVRTAGSQGNPNDLAAACLLLPLAWLAVPQRGAIAWYAACAIAVAPVWVFSASRQAAVGWVIAAATPMLMQLGWRRGVSLVGGMLAIAAVTVALQPVLRDRLLQTLSDGLGDRKPLIAFGLWQWWQRPLFGNGPGTFGELYVQAATSDWNWNGLTLARAGMPWAHNLIVEVLSDLGVMGATAFAWIVAIAARRLHRALHGEDTRRRVAMAAIALACSIAVVGMVDLTFIKEWFRCIFWVTLGLAFVQPCPRADGLASQK